MSVIIYDAWQEVTNAAEAMVVRNKLQRLGMNWRINDTNAVLEDLQQLYEQQEYLARIAYYYTILDIDAADRESITTAYDVTDIHFPPKNEAERAYRDTVRRS